MKTFSTSIAAALLLLAAHQTLRADDAAADKTVKMDVQAVHEEKADLNKDRKDRNKDAQVLGKDVKERTAAEGNLQEAKKEGDTSQVVKDKKEIREENHEIAKDKKELNGDKKEISKDKVKVARKARRLRHARSVEKKEEGKK